MNETKKERKNKNYRNVVLCEVCGKVGFRSWRWAKSRQYRYVYIGHGSGGDRHGHGSTRTWCYFGKMI